MRAFVLPLCAGLLVTGCAGHQRYDHARIIVAPAGAEPHLPARPGFDPQQPLGLEQAVRLALANNPDMHIATERLAAANARLRQSRAAFLPLVQAHAEYVRADAPSTYLFKTIDQRELPQRVDFNDPGILDNYEIGLGLRYNLYNGGRDRLDRLTAALGVRQGTTRRLAARNRLIAAVIVAWYDIRSAGEMVTTAKASHTAVEAQLDETRKVHAAGGDARKSDVLSLEARVAEAEETVIRARNAQRLAVAALANLLGENPDTVLDMQLGEACPCPIPATYEDAVATGLAGRPELVLARQEVEGAAIARDRARAEWLPRLDLEARTWWDDDHIDFGEDDGNWMLGLRLGWDVYTGGARIHRGAAARSELRAAVAADRRENLVVRLEIKRAYLQLEEAQARRDVAVKGLAAAEESLAMVRTQYQAGSVRITRYLEAETTHTRARMRLVRARYDLKQAEAEVARATGRFAHAELDPEESP
ncbi:MAG: TolC family protein [Planctomycetota bacterium]